MKPAFYDRPVLEVAPDLVGCVVSYDGGAGVIVEAEAYHESEPACHAYVGLTRRTEVLFGPPGKAYVYRSYGVHAMLNAVCEPDGVGAAVLIRALQPTARARGDAPPARAAARARPVLGPGQADPGAGHRARSQRLRSAARADRDRSAAAPPWRDVEVVADQRIGITQAVELPWRFSAAGSRFLSRPYRLVSA